MARCFVDIRGSCGFLLESAVSFVLLIYIYIYIYIYSLDII